MAPPSRVRQTSATGREGYRDAWRDRRERWVMEFHLADLYECVAAAVGERTAVVEGARRLTYAELLARTTGVAHGLASLGVRRGEHVGLCLRNTLEHLEAML